MMNHRPYPARFAAAAAVQRPEPRRLTWRLRHQAREARGFTLIEIMVVVIIIGLLAAVIVPQVVNKVDEARVTKAKADIEALETALTEYRLDNSSLPFHRRRPAIAHPAAERPRRSHTGTARTCNSSPKTRGAANTSTSTRVRTDSPMTSTHWVPMVSRAATTPLATGTATINRGLAPAAAGAPAASRASRHAGFTLLEILVVVLIIGILTAGMLLSLNFAGKDTQLETESKRLLSLMNYARDQAELQTRDYGIVFGQHGYEFVVYEVRTGAWRTIDEDDALRERTMPSGLDFQLVVDARPIVLDEAVKEPPPAPSDSSTDSTDSTDSTPTPQSHPSVPHTSSGSDSNSSSDSDTDSDSNSNATAFAPQVMIFSSGDLSSFSVTLERPSAGRSITLAENKDGDIIAKPMVGGDGK